MYQQTHFTIRGSYEYGNGFPDELSADAFQQEIEGLFRSAGWEIVPGNGHGGCAHAVREKEDLYLHPMEVSGIILRDSVPKVEALLRQAHTFRHCGTQSFVEYVEMSDERYQEHLKSRREDIRAAVLERFKTRRKNLFLTGDQSGIIARPFVVHRLEARRSFQEDIAVVYVRNLIEEMIANGELTVSQTRSGRGIRTTGGFRAAKKTKCQKKTR